MRTGASRALGEQVRRWRRWLVPGIGIKRWLAVVGAGIVVLSAGAVTVAALEVPAATGALARALGGLGPWAWLVPTVLLLGGGVLVLVGLRATLRSIDRVLFPTGQPTLVEVLRRQRTRGRGPRIVAVGGGTGLSTLLRGLKAYSSNITAVVTVFDDGGSSGRLRRDLGVPPPGDLRDCLVALAEAEPLMTRLFEYRFPGGRLDGHALGNLFIAGLVGVTGDLEQAVREASRVLNIRGRVLPATARDVVLVAEFADGTVVEGESAIPRVRKPIRRVALRPPDVPPLSEVLEAIGEADLILIGPGSLFTSVIPNLLVPGIAEALRGARAPRIYICNVMTQPGETDGFTAVDHVRALEAAVGGRVCTHVLVNTQLPRNAELLRRYQAEGSFPVAPDLEPLARLGYEVVAAAVISEEEVLRHDPRRLARAVMRTAAWAAPRRKPIAAS
jgi:uncharacterized cofD-like protein